MPSGLLSQFLQLQQNPTSGGAYQHDPQNTTSGIIQPHLQPHVTKAWLHVDSDGNLQHLEVEKHSIAMELRVPYRDLRMLDPQVPIPYPSALFIREKAMVVNLETVRMLICKDQVFVLGVPSNSSPDVVATPAADSPFVRELVLRIKAGQVDSAGTPLHRESIHLQIDRHLPYELRALECALSTVVRMLSRECADLEASASAPLERLSHMVSRLDLESIRNVKAHMNKLVVRVGKVKTVRFLTEELERILDDDNDMSDMYLGRREEQEAAEQAALQHQDSFTPRAASLDRVASIRESFLRSQLQDSLTGQPGAAPPSRPLPIGERSTLERSSDPQPGSLESNTEEVLRKLDELHRHTARTNATQVDPHDIDACEALLESYFMQVDFLLSGLLQLKDRIDDTEDLINIELDHRRNELVSLDLLVTMATAALTFMAVIAGIFGMNLNPLPISQTQKAFWIVISLGCGIALLIFLALVSYARYKGLLFLTTPRGMHLTSEMHAIGVQQLRDGAPAKLH